jgi:hypothetical protein
MRGRGMGARVSIGLSAAIMRVRLIEQASLPDLMRYLRSAECVVEEVGPGELSVLVPRAPSDEQARRELDLYLRAWQVMNPATEAEILD